MTLPNAQAAVRAKAFHPTGNFVPFSKEDAEGSISDRFEKIVRQFPDRLAVKTRAAVFTYAELNAEANRLAHALIDARGLRTEPVGLCFDEWSRLIVAHLAVLKAGKFSVALDPSADRERSRHIVKDCGLAVLVANGGTSEVAYNLAPPGCSILDSSALSVDLPTENPGVQVSPEATCYLRYTSGSTGNAKGAIKTHGHVLRDTMDFINEFHICPEDCVTHLRLGSIGKHMLEALLTGACFCPLDAHREGLVHVGDWLRQQRTTFLHSFPTALRYLLYCLPDSKRLTDLRLIELEGEPVFKSDIELLQKHVGDGCILVNTLSAAETGTVSMFFVDVNAPVCHDRIPVGYPMDGVEVLIRDDDGRPLAIDQIGEVAVSSNSLADGYWRRTDTTEQKFIEWGDKGKRMYLTGDLGYVSSDGCLHLLGRKDFQVKIRSHRVDVTEVEAALMEHSTVRSSIVVGREDPAGNTELIAYVVSQQETARVAGALRTFLAERLPDFMIPAKFVFMNELPLMGTGKIDRRALPEPVSIPLEPPVKRIAPRTPVETALAQIWCEVLLLKAVGVTEDFVDVGGHSLAASQVIARVNQKLALDLPVSVLFQAATIAQMAIAVEQHRAQPGGEPAVAKVLQDIESMSEADATAQLAKLNAKAKPR